MAAGERRRTELGGVRTQLLKEIEAWLTLTELSCNSSWNLMGKLGAMMKIDALNAQEGERSQLVESRVIRGWEDVGGKLAQKRRKGGWAELLDFEQTSVLLRICSGE